LWQLHARRIIRSNTKKKHHHRSVGEIKVELGSGQGVSISHTEREKNEKGGGWQRCEVGADDCCSFSQSRLPSYHFGSLKLFIHASSTRAAFFFVSFAGCVFWCYRPIISAGRFTFATGTKYLHPPLLSYMEKIGVDVIERDLLYKNEFFSPSSALLSGYFAR
jgi:hypothetical protein